MTDVTIKYIELNRAFPNKAMKLRSLLEAQKRLLLANKPKELMLVTAECYDVSVDLLDWMKLVLQGVANDAEALRDGAKIRNAMKFVNEENETLWDLMASEANAKRLRESIKQDK